MSDTAGVMSHWMRESVEALRKLRGDLIKHEHALEAAMQAIRVHTQMIENLERDIEIIETAVACTEVSDPVAPTSNPPPPPLAADDDEPGLQTRVRRVSDVTSPQSPPLRPVSAVPYVVG